MGPDASATPHRDSTRRYTAAQKEQALRLVQQLRAELGRKHGTVLKVAAQLGYGRETVRAWVREADTDHAVASDVNSVAQRIAELEREIERLQSQNAVLRQTAHSAGAPTRYDIFTAEHGGRSTGKTADLATNSHRDLFDRAG